MKDKNMENLYDYLFHYNSFNKEWNAYKRELNKAYFNGTTNENDILKNKDINILINFIVKQK